MENFKITTTFLLHYRIMFNLNLKFLFIKNRKWERNLCASLVPKKDLDGECKRGLIKIHIIDRL